MKMTLKNGNLTEEYDLISDNIEEEDDLDSIEDTDSFIDDDSDDELADLTIIDDDELEE